MPVNPAGQLTQLKQALAADQAKSGELSKEFDRLKDETADLIKGVSEIDGKSKGYVQSAQTAARQKTDLEAYIKSRKAVLEATVSNKDAIVSVKADAQKLVDKLGQTAKHAWTEAKCQRQASSEAEAETAKKRAVYDHLAGLSAENDKILAECARLRAAAEKESAANNVGRCYFNVLVLEGVLNELDLRSKYTADLTAAAADLKAARDAERLAKDTAEKAAAAARQAQEDFEAAKVGWQQKALEAIPDGNPRDIDCNPRSGSSPR